MDKENSECIVAGDYNIDLLKINEKKLFSEFFDTLTDNTFYPQNNTNNMIHKHM